MVELISAGCNDIGFYYDRIFGIVMKHGDRYVNMNEYYLESQAAYCGMDNYEPKLRRPEPSFIIMNMSFVRLKTVLAKVVNNAHDLPAFLIAIDLISSVSLMFSLSMEDLMSNITKAKDRQRLEFV